MCFFVMALGGLLLGKAEPLSAETLLSALARAYAGNPDLNQSRAAVRVRDEEMPKALAGIRPKVNIQASAGPLYGNLRLSAGRNAMTGQRQFTQEYYTGYPRGAALNVSQSIFDAGRTTNSGDRPRRTSSQRATMRLTEQATLQNGATAYMNVLRDTAIVNLRKSNIAVLRYYHRHRYYRRGYGYRYDPAGAMFAGAALSIMGAGIAAATAPRY
ncbi:MAG: hypothetical protein EKK29_20225 [Hyphomicrobiales bacterium]|nr:MAG: hypothetical protein EKK29_20225 [Hyphomicrobiales bacterium]